MGSVLSWSFSRLGRVLAMSGVVGMVLSGCVATGTRATYMDASDSCSIHRESLVASEEYFNESLVAGVAIGAALGAITGALTSGNRVQGALIGGGVGGAAGLLGGYLNAKMRQSSDQEELRAAIEADAGKDGAHLNKFSTAIRALNTCRSAQIAKLRSDFESGLITQDVAKQRLAKIRADMAMDADLIAKVLEDAKERNTIYAQAAAKTDDVEESIVLGKAESYKPSIVKNKKKAHLNLLCLLLIRRIGLRRTQVFKVRKWL